jgi:hypothetical protein
MARDTQSPQEVIGLADLLSQYRLFMSPAPDPTCGGSLGCAAIAETITWDCRPDTGPLPCAAQRRPDDWEIRPQIQLGVARIITRD